MRPKRLHPQNKFIRCRHRGKPALAHQSPIVEQARLFDFPQRYRRFHPAAKTEIRDREPGILRIGSSITNDVCNADDRRVTKVHLTTKARRLRDRLLQISQGVNDQGAEGVNPAELAQFRRLIARMTANLDRVER